MRSARSVNCCLAVMCLLVFALGSVKADDETAADGKAVGGLRLHLTLPTTESDKKLQPQCNLSLENVGDSDLNVQLGISSANGKSYHAVAIRLFARSNGNKPITLIYSPPRVAGRIDPFVLPLLARSSYTLRCSFDKYVDSETGKPIDLTAKNYRITAELVGQAVTNINRDMQGLALMPYWLGKVHSNEVQLTFAKTRPVKL